MTAPTRATAAARIREGYAPASGPPEHVAQRLARAWAFDPQMERLAALRETPARWSAVPQASRLSVGYYVGAREAARSLGVDVTAPAATA